MDPRPILAFGDSHALIFRNRDTIFPTPCGTPGIDVLQCADATAYGFGRPDSKYLRLLEKAFHKQQYAAIIVSAGGIDCRAHIVARAKQKGASIEEEAANVARRYLAAIASARRYGDAPVIILSPAASTPVQEHPKWIVSGDILERNRATAAFRDTLRSDPTVSVLDLLDLSLAPDGSTNAATLYDKIHVKCVYLPLLLATLRALLRLRSVEWAERGGGDFKICCQHAPTDKKPKAA